MGATYKVNVATGEAVDLDDWFAFSLAAYVVWVVFLIAVPENGPFAQKYLLPIAEIGMAEYCLFLIALPPLIVYLWLVVSLMGEKSHFDKMVSLSNELKKEAAPIRRKISAMEKLQTAKNKLTKLEQSRDDGKKQLEKLEKDVARDENTAATLRDRISSLEEEEIPALWDSIAHLIPFSTALEKA